jgi:Vacuolar protein sorting-associated protein 35
VCRFSARRTHSLPSGLPDAATVVPVHVCHVSLQDFEEEQVLVARLLHNLVAEDPDTQFEVLQAARDRLVRGGPERMKYTLPPIVFTALSLLRSIKQAQERGKQGEATTEAVCTCCPHEFSCWISWPAHKCWRRC